MFKYFIMLISQTGPVNMKWLYQLESLLSPNLFWNFYKQWKLQDCQSWIQTTLGLNIIKDKLAKIFYSQGHIFKYTLKWFRLQSVSYWNTKDKRDNQEPHLVCSSRAWCYHCYQLGSWLDWWLELTDVIVMVPETGDSGPGPGLGEPTLQWRGHSLGKMNLGSNSIPGSFLAKFKF